MVELKNRNAELMEYLSPLDQHAYEQAPFLVSDIMHDAR